MRQLPASSPPGLVGAIIVCALVGTFLSSVLVCVVRFVLEIFARLRSDVVQDYEAFAFILLWLPVQILIGLGLLVVAVPAWWLLFASKRCLTLQERLCLEPLAELDHEPQPVLTNRQERFDLAVRQRVSVPNGASELYEEERTTDMVFLPDLAAFKKSFDSLPVSTFEPGESVLAAGSTTGQVFILRRGLVEVVRDGLQVATVSEPGAVFGELSVILDKPHTADVRAVERSEFHVAKASSLLTEDVAALLYVSAILARRLDTANEVIVEIKRELESAKRPAITKALEKLEKLLSPAGTNTPDFNYHAYYPPMF